MSEQRPAAGPSPLAANLCIGLLCLIWGSTWVVIKLGLSDLPPFGSAAVRFVIAASVMAALAPRIARGEGGGRPPRWLVLCTGLGQFALSYAIVYWAETVLPSGLVSVLWAVYPLVLAGVSHVVLPDERLRPVQWLGFLLGFAGVATLFRSDLSVAGPEAVLAGAVLLLSPLVVAISTALIKRYGKGLSSAYLNRDSLGVGAVLLALAAILFERDADYAWTPVAVGSIAYLSLVGTVLTFGLYFWLMRYVPAWRLSLIAYVTPVIALLLGAVVVGEPVGFGTVVGTGLILAGVAMALVFKGGRR